MTATDTTPPPTTVPSVRSAEAADLALSWQAPGDWTPKPTSAMRKGSFAVSRGGENADLSITTFPGDVGGLAANVNRWRGQIGLPPVEATALGSLTQAIDANGLHFVFVDFAGPMPTGQQRILAALASWQGATWFFKLTGPSSFVEAQRPAFLTFLKTVRPR